MTGGERETLGGIVTIVIVGVLLGVSYNALGRREARGWGIDWIGRDRVAELGQMAAVGAVEAGPAGSSLYTGSDDPLAGLPGAANAAEHPANPGPSLPEIPAIGRPVPVDAAALKQLVDASAVYVIDARDPEEFAEGHIPGAVSLPFDEAITDPVRLEALDTAGRPIVTYCGGGTCEISLSLADELFFAGHDRVAVYMGGYPEWVGLGYPVEAGGAR